MLGEALTSAQLNLVKRNREEARRRKEQRRAATSSGQGQNIDKEPQVPEDSDEIMCIICRDKLRNGETLYGLECAHMFHEHCIMKCAKIKGKDVRDCCPYHCHQSSVTQSFLVQDVDADADEVAETPVEGPEAAVEGLSVGQEAAEGLESMGLDTI